MSLVTTASESSSRRVRQSAATVAVLPEPTGPPSPIRSARGRAGADQAWRTGASYGSTWSRCKETHLPGAVLLGMDIEQRGGGRGQLAALGGGHGLGRHRVQSGCEPGELGRDLVRVETEQPDA